MKNVWLDYCSILNIIYRPMMNNIYLIDLLILILLKMGFRIRDKSLFWTISGWKNNWEPKILNMPRMIKSNQTAYITSRYDHHSFLRSSFSSKLSGSILQKLFKNMQTIFIRRLQSRTNSYPRIKKYLQNSLLMLNSS